MPRRGNGNPTIGPDENARRDVRYAENVSTSCATRIGAGRLVPSRAAVRAYPNSLGVACTAIGERSGNPALRIRRAVLKSAIRKGSRPSRCLQVLPPSRVWKSPPLSLPTIAIEELFGPIRTSVEPTLYADAWREGGMWPADRAVREARRGQEGNGTFNRL